MKIKIKKLLNKYKEIITYIIFGVLTTAVNWACYTILVKCGLNENDFQLTVSNAIAWVVGVLFAFVTNKIWVFESRSWKMPLAVKEFISFVAARAITGVLEIFGLPILLKVGIDQPLFGVDGFLAKIIISVVVVILNYVFSKLIVFKNKNDKNE